MYMYVCMYVFLYRIHVHMYSCQFQKHLNVWCFARWYNDARTMSLGLLRLLNNDKANLEFRIVFRRLSTPIMAVTMEPNPDKLKENIILNFRHLKVTPTIKLCGRLAPISLKKLSN